MGLDWMVDKYRPRRGKERAFRSLKARLEELREQDQADDGAESKLLRTLQEVAHSAWDELEAPRVGIDARATRWFEREVYAREVQQAEETGAPPRPFSEALAEAHGQYVTELARNKDGLAGGSFLASSLDFGAGVIDACVDVVDGDLIAEAWSDHSASEAGDYALRLERALKSARSPVALRRERLRESAREQGPFGPEIASVGCYPEEPWVRTSVRGGVMSFEEQRRTVRGLVRWLKFWSSRGYGFVAWS